MTRLLLCIGLLLSPLAGAQAPQEEQSAPARGQQQPEQQQAEQQQAEQQQPQPEQQRQPPMQEYVEFVKRVQIALHQHGFDPGQIDGRDDGRTQAALAQFQLSRNLPASGSMDEQTLKALGVERAALEDESASAGAGMPLAKP